MTQIKIIMPQMGQSVAEGTIIKWRKQAGDAVHLDEVLLEVETDKTTVDVESPAAGKLATCLKQAGEVAAAGEVIGLIEAVDQPKDSSSPQAEDKPHAAGVGEQITVQAASVSIFNSAPLPEINRDRYSPYVLRTAMLNNVSLKELEGIPGTGRQGRLTRNDILQYLARRPAGSQAAPSGKQDMDPEDLEALGQVLPMTSIRRTIADHMVQSIRTSAHVTMVHAVDVTHVVALRDRVKGEFEKRYQAKLTYTAVLLFVTSRVLHDFPVINASVFGSNLVLRNAINIGCAVALSDESLVVPVVKHADKLSFLEIARELDRLIRRARERSLTRVDVENGTFSISNFGAFGSLIGTPIIHQPQVAILGMGAVAKTPVVLNNEICIRDRLFLSFSFDHRVIDGAMGGRFLNAIQVATEALTEDDLQVGSLIGK
ncbi:MAG: dihydrolipoamide acetyltransferase family protein [Lentisphaerota bacterium]